MKNRPFIQRLGFALAGLKAAWKYERSFRTQCFYAIAALGLLLSLQPSPIWWALIMLLVMAVMAAELVNTALEHLADHLHPDKHPKIKLVKDCGAAAVLVLSFAALCAVLALLYEHLL